MKCPPKAHVRTPELQLVVLPSWEDCGTFRRYSLGWKESPGKVPEFLQSSLVPCFLSASLVCMWCDQPASRFSLQMVPFLWFSAVMMASLGILRQKKKTLLPSGCIKEGIKNTFCRGSFNYLFIIINYIIILCSYYCSWGCLCVEVRGQLSEVVSFLPTDIQVIRLVRQVLPSGSITQVIGWGILSHKTKEN